MNKINETTPDAPQSLSPLFWQIAGVMAMAARLVTGWTYWGGASRRLIYATAKLDPTSQQVRIHKVPISFTSIVQTR